MMMATTANKKFNFRGALLKTNNERKQVMRGVVWGMEQKERKGMVGAGEGRKRRKRESRKEKEKKLEQEGYRPLSNISRGKELIGKRRRMEGEEEEDEEEP